VHVESLGSDGIVAEDFGDTVLVAVGAMKTVVPKTGLRRAGRHAIETSRRRAEQATATIERAARTTDELDVRGRRYVEAEPLVERWLDEARVLGTSPLRLIHGKGTGLLGRGLQQFLRENHDVASVRYGNADEGGGGVTIVELK
jgi:DNA mismatch repair protein MutS2